MKKLIIFSAPSGSGKTTIVKRLLKNDDLKLKFSVSATSRAKRTGETNGVDYHFLSPEEFEQKIKNNEFLEWEQVYKGSYYGTLKSEIARIEKTGYHVIFDVDVVGGLNIKKYYKEKALALFIKPPSIAELENRLQKRGTDTPQAIQRRVAKAQKELAFSSDFDKIIVNDILDNAVNEAYRTVKFFLTT